MVENLNMLKEEKEKIEKSLQKTRGNDYKRYATLWQVYIGLVNTINQTEAILKQQEEERKRKEEEERILKEAEEQIKAENKQKEKKRQSKEV